MNDDLVIVLGLIALLFFFLTVWIFFSGEPSLMEALKFFLSDGAVPLK